MRYSKTQNMKDNRLARTLVALLAAGFVLMAASSAFALDGYAKRKGLFAGIGIGGGVGGVDLQEGEGQAGFEDGRLPGFHVNGMIGGGVNENIVLGTQFNWWGRTVTKGDDSWEHHHTSLLAAGDFFLINGLYLEVGGGLAYSAFDGTRGDTPVNHNEMGFALKGGAGFEYFINGTHALGFNAGYTRHFYDMATFDTFNAGISVRWY
ncbi:porin family protein [Persicimonas caeni]|uniref:Porin family protein n=1 Tax=Persicimonas caeni TaxID=2292766 RepID=A0A4Y6PT26_PERCE|nr:outer membrane beta-barrel protein [Persicimonas caeni]QDG51458.1 porin family protein [Persicimonas caeni]QED32679.1 porin family protein [Persicimonas caeni]